ncbi:hypothetical protein BKA60DRAFT_582284 [Fusarium oxysporum]|nr:hypothetical protein BKA60DRAFT_582284 [Fusarium oxysporum]
MPKMVKDLRRPVQLHNRQYLARISNHDWLTSQSRNGMHGGRRLQRFNGYRMSCQVREDGRWQPSSAPCQ